MPFTKHSIASLAVAGTGSIAKVNKSAARVDTARVGAHNLRVVSVLQTDISAKPKDKS